MGFTYSSPYSYCRSSVSVSAWNRNRNRNRNWNRDWRRTRARTHCSLSNSNSNSNASSSSSGPDKEKEKERQGLSRSAAYSLLKQQLAVAAKLEDYEAAARLRDSLRSFEEEEPVLQLRNRLRKAVEEERYVEAARYRDQLQELAPHALLKCSSDATTQGIRVQVRSVYMESRSRPVDGHFFYAYRIRISNNSAQAVQLLRRHWIVTDGRGRTEHVWGTGVVGQQPVIPPGAAFEYSSACPLGTPSGRMEGDFEMKPLQLLLEPEAKPENKTTFNVAIAPFSLSVLGDDCSSSSSSSSAFLY